jgi:hypothetical protein
MRGDADPYYFVDGIVEEITTGISRLPWLFVTARNSSFAYKGKSPDLRQVGRELGDGRGRGAAADVYGNLVAHRPATGAARSGMTAAMSDETDDEGRDVL